MNHPSRSCETIFALSSGGLPSGVAVIRLSGPGTGMALTRLAGDVPPRRQMRVRILRDDGGGVIDTALVVFFKGPESFTGEDSGELHLHGGPAVVRRCLEELGRLDGLRHAEPGEFSKQAFLNGKLDLTEAEALSDLIAAETEAQRRLAVVGADGAQSRLYETWQERITTVRAHIEAELDFSDEDDVPDGASSAHWDDLAALTAEMSEHLEGYRLAEMIQDGFRVVIVGAPNAGKSSLLNALARRDVAIVSKAAGTTRDAVDVTLDLDGHKVIVTDTAGLRAAKGVVEKEGIRRALKRASDADLVLIATDLSDPRPITGDLDRVDTMEVGTKLDLCVGEGEADDRFVVKVSAHQGKGMTELMEAIAVRVPAFDAGSQVLPSQLRHRDGIRTSIEALQRALTKSDAPLEIRAEYLRESSDALGRITGRVGVEDILDVVFSRFCIGK